MYPEFDTTVKLTQRSDKDDLTIGNRDSTFYTAELKIIFDDNYIYLFGEGVRYGVLRENIVSLEASING